MPEQNQPNLTQEQRIFNYIQTALQSILLIIIIVLNFISGDCNTLPPISVGNETIPINAPSTTPQGL
jgi:hypothetical protein